MSCHIPECVYVARDVRCGTLHCVNADELLSISGYRYVSNRRVTITEQKSTFTCRLVS